MNVELFEKCASYYCYGFNGKENDNEVKGTGNQQDYGMRIYDPRLGKFLSVDPLHKEYPWNSTYAFAENDVIRSTDLDGLEKYVQIRFFDPNNPNRAKSNVIVKMRYKDVVPGQNYGPFGKAGTAKYSYDLSTKKLQFRSYNSEEVLDDNVTFKNSQPIHVKGEHGSPAASTNLPFGEFDGNTNPVTSDKGGPGGYDGAPSYNEENIIRDDEKHFDHEKRLDNYTNGDKKTTGVAVDETGDTTDVFDYDRKTHNYKKGSDGWKDGVRKANESKLEKE